MGHTQSHWSWPWCEIIPDEKVRPAYMVPLAKAVVDWAAQDLSLKKSPKVIVKSNVIWRRLYPGQIMI
jgi:hypothetical protein